MNKVLIPTKLSNVAANTLKTAGYEVVQDADTPLEEQAAAHPDTAAGLDHNYVLDSEPGDKIAASTHPTVLRPFSLVSTAAAKRTSCVLMQGHLLHHRPPAEPNSAALCVGAFTSRWYRSMPHLYRHSPRLARWMSSNSASSSCSMSM